MTLWNFALALYAKPGVEGACLDAQDAGADVCLLLCGAWLDWRAAEYQAARAQTLRELARQRQATLIQPLRNVRQQLRQAAQHASHMARLREQVRELELAAERQLLEQLQALSQAWPVVDRAPERAWLDALGERLEADHPALQVIHSQALSLPPDARTG